MSNQALTQTKKQEVATPHTVKGWLQSDQFKSQVALVASKYITPDRFVRVALTALLKTPKLAHCSIESVLKSCLGCAQMGVEPDGRNAHLIPYGTECSLQVDWKGYVSIAKRNGINVSAKVVCQNDKFSVEEDDGSGRTKVTHVVDYTKDRGEMVAVYSRAVEEGYVDYEILSRKEVEYVRDTFSKAKDADAWKKSFAEMARKTAIKRHSKRWNLDVDLEEDNAIATVSATTGTVVVDVPPALPEFGAPQIEDNPELAPVEKVAEPTPQPEPKPTKKAPKPVMGIPTTEEPLAATPSPTSDLALEAAMQTADVVSAQVLGFYNKSNLRQKDAPEAAALSDLPEPVKVVLAKQLNEGSAKILAALKAIDPV